MVEKHSPQPTPPLATNRGTLNAPSAPRGGLAEMVTVADDRVPGRLGQRVHEAVAEVQRRAMVALPEAPPRTGDKHRETARARTTRLSPHCRNPARRRQTPAVASASVSDETTDGPWQPELDELARRRAMAQQMGGPEKVERHHANGKLTVRERIDALLDPGTFREVGALTGRATTDADGNLTAVMPANFVMGRGRIDGRVVVVGGDDFTVRGGAADASIFQKQVMAERMAHDYGLPIVRCVDGSGGGGSVKTLETERRSFVPFNPGWEWVVANLGRVPVVGLCLGSVAGLGAARVVTSHYSLMVTGTSQLFVAGPPVVNRLGIEEVDKETLGGSAIHTRNGAVDDEVGSEAEAFARARAFLSYLPSSVDELPPRADPTDDPEPRGARARLRHPARATPRLQGAVHHRARRRPRRRRRLRRASSRSDGTGADPPSPAWRDSTAGPSRSSPTIRTTTPAAGPPTHRARSSASSTSPRRSACRSCTSSTTRAS